MKKFFIALALTTFLLLGSNIFAKKVYESKIRIICVRYRTHKVRTGCARRKLVRRGWRRRYKCVTWNYKTNFVPAEKVPLGYFHNKRKNNNICYAYVIY